MKGWYKWSKTVVIKRKNKMMSTTSDIEIKKEKKFLVSVNRMYYPSVHVFGSEAEAEAYAEFFVSDNTDSGELPVEVYVSEVSAEKSFTAWH